MSRSVELFERSPAEVEALFGAPLGTRPGGPRLPGRANAKSGLKFVQSAGAFNVEVGFGADDAVCYAIFEKKNRTPIEEIEVRQILLLCAARAEWTDVTPTVWNPRARRSAPVAGIRDFQYRETDAKKNVARILLARHQLRPGRVAVWTLAWQADIEKELRAAVA